MDDTDNQKTAKVLWNIIQCFQSVAEDNERLPGSKLSHGEEFYDRNLYSLLLKLRMDSASQPAVTTIKSLKEAAEKSLPIYQKLYGQEAVIGSLSFLATDESSIALMRQAGAEKTAALCAEARQERVEKFPTAANKRENADLVERARELLHKRAAAKLNPR